MFPMFSSDSCNMFIAQNHFLLVDIKQTVYNSWCRQQFIIIYGFSINNHLAVMFIFCASQSQPLLFSKHLRTRGLARKSFAECPQQPAWTFEFSHTAPPDVFR